MEERRRHVLHTPSLRHSLVGYSSLPPIPELGVLIFYYLSIDRKKRQKEVHFPSVFLVTALVPWTNYNIDTKAKCHHLKKFTSKGTLRQLFIRVTDWRYRTVTHVGIFDICSFVNCCLSLPPCLWFYSPPPLCETVYCIVYTRIQCGGGGVWGAGQR
jgi:hypothetical protein